ncbi:MAG TPA: nucleotidyltransferase family protein [Anaerolineae bacterium]
MKNDRIAGVILAAGESKRLGQPKQLISWNGKPLIEHTARVALAGGLDPVVVVIGYRADEVRAAIQAPATIIENPRWHEGMSTSLHAGLDALPSDVIAAIMLLIDQPRVDARHIKAMVEAYRSSVQPIVVSTFQGRRASPTLFDRSLFGELAQVSGDTGGRSVLLAHPDRVTAVEAGSEITLLDIDTPDDWQRIQNG